MWGPGLNLGAWARLQPALVVEYNIDEASTYNLTVRNGPNVLDESTMYPSFEFGVRVALTTAEQLFVYTFKMPRTRIQI